MIESNHQNATPKHFALQLGSLLSLYLSLSFLIVLLFGMINLKFPDITEGYYLIEQASNNVRLGIAMVVVFFPTYLILTRFVNKTRRSEVSEQYLTLTKWLIYLSLVIGIGALLIDLVIVIMTYLNGEVTPRFIYKAASVLVVIGAAVHYYVLDARGYWIKNESQSILYAIGAFLFAFVIVAFGFANIETPAAVREMKIDQTEITDLQTIQYKIEEHLGTTKTLPATLTDAFGEFDAPTAPEGRTAYTYVVTAAGFELCAEFARDSTMDEFMSGPKFDQQALIGNANDWQYKAGNYCFKRIVTK